MRFELGSLDELAIVAKEFVQNLNDSKIFAFYGEMGSGKTTFIKYIARELGVLSIVNSPTFAIINEYKTLSNQKIYHFDCYRLKNLDEAIQIGAEDYLYSGNTCFIEWPQVLEPILPENTISIEIKVIEDKRIITLNYT